MSSEAKPGGTQGTQGTQGVPPQDTLVHIPPSEVKVRGDQPREEFGDLEGLAQSIKHSGLAQPLVVDSEGFLIAGERRLRASILAQLPLVPCLIRVNLTEQERFRIQLVENLWRKDLEVKELCGGILKLHTMMQEEKGKVGIGAANVKGEGWGLKDTAEVIGHAPSYVSEALAVAKWGKEFPEVWKAAGLHSAYKMLVALQQRVVDGELRLRMMTLSADFMTQQSMEDPEGVPQWKAWIEDNVVVMQGIPSESVDLLLTDPPYGIDVENSSQIRESIRTGRVLYSGDADVEAVFVNLGLVLKEAYRIMKPNTHGYVFCVIQHWSKIVETVLAAGFEMQCFPLIWDKGGAFLKRHEHLFGPTYEPIAFIFKGRRALSQVKPAVFQCTPPRERIHPTQKPAQLLSELIELSTIPGEVVLDPFAGSFSTVRAALQLGRQGWGIERDPLFAGDGIDLLKKGL